jgi:LCP family protein required for cell wall assembly
MIIRINNLDQSKKSTVSNPAQAKIVPPKPPKVKRRFNKKLFITLLVIFFGIIGILFAIDRFTSYSSRVERYDEQGNKVDVCDNVLNPKCWTEAFKPQLKQSDGYTGALIIGVDTRPGTSGLMNTDSIIGVFFNHKTQEIMMVSIPRDFWSMTYGTKINAVYALTYKKGQSEKQDEFYYLKEEVSKIVGKPIQYMAKVHFEGVISLVDQLGGVDVCPPDAFTARYPNDKAKRWDKEQWFLFPFVKGCQPVDGNKALVYARFRYISKGPSYLASDFSRARRQQEVIDAIKVKALSDNVPLETKAENFWNIFQTLTESIKVDITFEDLMAGMVYLNTFDRKFVNIVLDPNFQGLNKYIYTDSNESQGYTIKARDKSYNSIKNEIANIWKFSAFFKESPKIAVRNQTGDKNLPNENLAIRLKNETSYYNSFDVYNDAKTDKFNDIKIFDFTAGAKPKSLETIKAFLNIEDVETLPEQYGITRSKKNEDFLIVVGPAVPPTPTSTVAPVTTTPN